MNSLGQRCSVIRSQPGCCDIFSISGAAESDAIVMDFFGGSGSIAHALLQMNRGDGGNRRCVLVQLPENTDRQDYATIAEIGEQRIRRVIAKLDAESECRLDTAAKGTAVLGLRVFKLAASAMRQWQPVDPDDPQAAIDQMGLFIDPLVDGWQPEALLWEVAVREGYALHSRVELVDDLPQNTVHRVSDPDLDQSFLMCLDGELHDATITALGLGIDDLFVCRDVALSDEQAANLALQCRLKTL